MAAKNVSASDVRAWGRANLDKVPEAGHKSLGETARGRLHPEVIAAFKKAHKGKKAYEPRVAEDRTVTVKVPAKDKAGRNITKKVTIPTSEARAILGHAPGRRGRFNMSDLSEALKAQV